jgi:hypothetical protein
MNTQRATQFLLDPEWLVAVAEELTSNPMGVAFAVEPAIMGAYDCQLGLPCDPAGRGYRKLGDVNDYCAAYNDTAALWAATVQAENDKLHADRAWMDGLLQELIDGREDEDYWRIGQW